MNTTDLRSQTPLIIEVIGGWEFLFRCFSDDPDPVFFFPVRDGVTLSIGRGSGCDIRVSGLGSDPAEGCILARRHVDLNRDKDVVSIVDIGSTIRRNFKNRVYLNGCCLADMGEELRQVRPGDQFSVGPVTFQLRCLKPNEQLDPRRKR